MSRAVRASLYHATKLAAKNAIPILNILALGGSATKAEIKIKIMATIKKISESDVFISLSYRCNDLCASFDSKVFRLDFYHASVWMVPNDAFNIVGCKPLFESFKISRCGMGFF